MHLWQLPAPSGRETGEQIVLVSVGRPYQKLGKRAGCMGIGLHGWREVQERRRDKAGVGDTEETQHDVFYKLLEV